MSDQRSRTFTRVPVHVRAEFHLEGGAVGSGVVQDLSMNGLAIHTPVESEPGMHARVAIVLESGGEALRIGTSAEVTRADGSSIAFRFLSVDGDAYEHLEKLVLFNSDDASRVEQELQVHADDQPPMSVSGGL